MHVVRAVRADDVDELVDIDTIVHVVSLEEQWEIRSLPPREPRRLFFESQLSESCWFLVSRAQDRCIEEVNALDGSAVIDAEWLG